uniref:DNA-directed RNA polymerases I, II, and III subunit RPABC1 n=1 Tax=Anthurium amnicola TaxID=1678845 RepID=A0A1D1Y2Q8_9ARAE
MEGGGGCLASFIDQGSVESHRYFLARRTLLEMLRDRGYAVPDVDIHQTLPEFRSMYGQQPDLDRLLISASLASDPSRKVLVIFSGPGKFKLSTFRGIIDKFKNEISPQSRMILVLGDKPTSQARQATKEFSFKVETFQITELLVNVTKHTLMPKHEILIEEDKQKLLKKYSVEDSQVVLGSLELLNFLRENVC